MLREKPADSITNNKFWDWRFKFYYVKKAYLSRLVAGGFSVIQADTDTVWSHDPFPALRTMGASLVVMREYPTIANAGLIYARPGSVEARDLLDEARRAADAEARARAAASATRPRRAPQVAWRVQLFQHYPEAVRRVVHFASPPYYANSDDQTILDDVLVSAVLRNRTFLGSTARFEASTRYKPAGPKWDLLPDARLLRAARVAFWRAARYPGMTIPWLNGTLPDGCGGQRYADGAFGATTARCGRASRVQSFPAFGLGSSSDLVGIAPRALFALMPYSDLNAVTHLTAARGFSAKKARLKQIGKWFVEEREAPADEPPRGGGAAGGAAARGGHRAAKAHHRAESGRRGRGEGRVEGRVAGREGRSQQVGGSQNATSRRGAHQPEGNGLHRRRRAGDAEERRRPRDRAAERGDRQNSSSAKGWKGAAEQRRGARGRQGKAAEAGAAAAPRAGNRSLWAPLLNLRMPKLAGG